MIFKFIDLNPTGNGRYYDIYQLGEKINEILNSQNKAHKLLVDNVPGEFNIVDIEKAIGYVRSVGVSEEGELWVDIKIIDTPMGEMFKFMITTYGNDRFEAYPVTMSDVDDDGKVDILNVLKLSLKLGDD